MENVVFQNTDPVQTQRVAISVAIICCFFIMHALCKSRGSALCKSRGRAVVQVLWSHRSAGVSSQPVGPQGFTQ